MFEYIRARRLFPTTIFQHKLVESESLNVSLCQEIYAMQAHQPTMDDGRSNNWQSQDNLHMLTAFAPLTDCVHEAVQQILEFMRYAYEAFVITSMWANILRPGEAHAPHMHANNLLSGVYYVKSSDSELSRIYYQDPRGQSGIFVPRIKEYTHENANLWSFPSEEGTMFVFPSWLVHFVKPNTSGEDRISISFNIMLRGALGTHDQLQYSEIF
jgi:uncharacterized protein (TIGR02466 family)